MPNNDWYDVVSMQGHGSPVAYHLHYSGQDEQLAHRSYRQAVQDMTEAVAEGLIEGQAIVQLVCNDDVEKQKEWPV